MPDVSRPGTPGAAIRPPRTAAARQALQSTPSSRAELQAALVAVEAESAAPYRAELGWALDLLDQYDLHLLEHGDPIEVYSADQAARRRRVRHMLDEEP